MALKCNTPDPEALGLARLVQEAVSPDTVILFGSRARGDHRPDSDMDLMLICLGDTAASRKKAITALSKGALQDRHNPKAEIIAMSRDRFDYFSRAKNHVTAQALKEGVIMSSERLGYGNQYDDHYSASWPDVKQKLESGYQQLRAFEREFNNPDGEQEVYGFHAQQAVENALKGWISAAELTYDRSHNLEHLSATLLSNGDQNQCQAAVELQTLLDYTRTGHLNEDGSYQNWLTSYSVKYRYEGVGFRMHSLDEKRFEREITTTFDSMAKRAFELTKTDNSDLDPPPTRQRRDAT